MICWQKFINMLEKLAHSLLLSLASRTGWQPLFHSIQCLWKDGVFGVSAIMAASQWCLMVGCTLQLLCPVLPVVWLNYC